MPLSFLEALSSLLPCRCWCGQGRWAGNYREKSKPGIAPVPTMAMPSGAAPLHGGFCRDASCPLAIAAACFPMKLVSRPPHAKMLAGWYCSKVPPSHTILLSLHHEQECAYCRRLCFVIILLPCSCCLILCRVNGTMIPSIGSPRSPLDGSFSFVVSSPGRA